MLRAMNSQEDCLMAVFPCIAADHCPALEGAAIHPYFPQERWEAVRAALVPFGLFAVEKGCAATCTEFWLLALVSCYRRAFGKPEMQQTGSMQTFHFLRNSAQTSCVQKWS